MLLTTQGWLSRCGLLREGYPECNKLTLWSSALARAIDDLDDIQASENRGFEDASRRLCVQTPAAFVRPA
jgi:hypothetical protein